MIIRRYRVSFVCERLYYVEEWRFIRSHRPWKGARRYKCTAHWKRWNSPILETRSRRMANRVAKLLNLRESSFYPGLKRVP